MSSSSSIKLLMSSKTVALLTSSYSEGIATTEACKEMKLSLVQKTLQMVLCKPSSSVFGPLVDLL